MPLCSDPSLVSAPWRSGCCSSALSPPCGCSLFCRVPARLPALGLHLTLPVSSALPLADPTGPGVGWDPLTALTWQRVSKVIASGSHTSLSWEQKCITLLLSPFLLPCWRAPDTVQRQGRYGRRCRSSSQSGIRAVLAKGHCSRCTDLTSKDLLMQEWA